MGIGKTYKCLNCNNIVELYEGVGEVWHSYSTDMFYPPKKGNYGMNFYNELNKRVIKEAQKFIEEYKDVCVTEAYLQPYICEECGKVKSDLYFKIESKSNTFSPKYFCRCGGQYKRLTKKAAKHLHCNKCGHKMVQISGLLWD